MYLITLQFILNPRAIRIHKTLPSLEIPLYSRTQLQQTITQTIPPYIQPVQAHTCLFVRTYLRTHPPRITSPTCVCVYNINISTRIFARFAFVWTAATCTRFSVLFCHCLCAHHIPVNVYIHTVCLAVFRFA